MHCASTRHYLKIRPFAGPRLICSNSSTLDRAIPDLHAGSIDVKIRTWVGPKFATTRRPPPSASHHPSGAKIRDENTPSRGQFR